MQEEDNTYLPLNLINSNRIVVYEKWVPVTYRACKKCDTCGHNAIDTDDNKTDTDNEKTDIIDNNDNDIIDNNDNDDEETNDMLYQKVCLLTESGDRYHKYVDFNKFSIETYPIPTSNELWELSTNDREIARIKSHTFDKNANIFDASLVDVHQLHPGYKLIKTLDNYHIGFVIFLNQDTNHIVIYTTTEDVIDDSCECEEISTFTRKISEYNVIEIFTGTSAVNEMTTYSGGHGDKWDNNTMLFRIASDNENEYRYLHVGSSVYEFTTNEKIIKYVSSVGNNCVPYPYAESLNYCYSMLEQSVTPVKDHVNRDTLGYIDYVTDATYQDMENVNEIHPRSSLKIAQSSKEETSYVRMSQKKFKLVENSCNDQSLPLVTFVNTNLN